MTVSNRITLLLCFIAIFCLVLPMECPAPLIWRKGEGWSFDQPGAIPAKTPKEQLEVARKFQQKQQFDAAVSAYRRLLRRWPTSTAAQDARLGLAESLTGLGYLYKAFREYQQLIDKNPNSPYFNTALERQFAIGNRFLAGEKHKVWRFRIFNGIDKAAEVFEQVVKNGPFSKLGPPAQFRVGLVYEKQKDYLSAVHAYEKLLERYPQDELAEEAQFQIGWAYKQEAGRADYDQNNANQAIAALSDYLLRYPSGKKATEAEQLRTELKQEQSRGLFRIGEFYEKQHHYKAARIYFNEVIEQNPKSTWAKIAEQKLTLLATAAKESAATR